MITAIAIGGDLIPRLRMAAGTVSRVGWEGPTVSPLGVVATVGKLRDCDKTVLANAMGAAYAHCAGNILSTSDATWDVWLNAGIGVRAGLTAVELAQRGHQGARAPLLGGAGLYPLYFRGEYHAEALLSDLLNDEALHDPAILRMFGKISVEATAEKDALQKAKGYPPDDVGIHTVDGQIYRGCERYVKGHPQNPMTFDEVVE